MRVTATSFIRHFGVYQDDARDEPIEVTSHGRTIGYFISIRDFDEYQVLQKRLADFAGAGEHDNK
jgi:prevent-host-death family protein